MILTYHVYTEEEKIFCNLCIISEAVDKFSTEEVKIHF